MRDDGPSLGEELAALGDLYLTVLWMLRQRWRYGPAWQYHHRWSAVQHPEETARRDPEAVTSGRD